MPDKTDTTTPSSVGLWDDVLKSEAFSHEWHVFFVSSGRQQGWWRIFTRPGFEHCFAITYDPETARWFIVDWHICFLVAQPLQDEMVEMLILMAKLEDYKIVRFKPKHDGRIRYRFGWNYCVSAMKHLLGLQSWAVTPYQLYCHLLKKGGKEGIAGGA